MKTRINGLCQCILVVLLLIVATSACLARSMPVRRVPLNDEIGLLDDQMAAEIKQISQLLYRDFKSEMAILIMHSTDGANHNDYAQRVFNDWKLGQAGSDSGILIMFAIDDEGIEIIPGVRYQDKFNVEFCTNLLTTHVDPEIKAGRTAQGVLAATREVAAAIRQSEETGTGLSYDQTESTKSSESTANKSSASPDSTNSNNTDSKKVSKIPKIKLFAYIFMATWMTGGFYYCLRAFKHGHLLMEPAVFLLLVVLCGIIMLFFIYKIFDFTSSALDQFFLVTGSLALVSFIWCAGHICPKCSKYMIVHTKTLHSPTYNAPGLGEETRHCDNCGYHLVTTHQIARRTRRR